MNLLAFIVGCADPEAVPDDTASEGVTWVREPEICASPLVSLAASGGGYIATTEHYTLTIEGFDETEAENLAALAETAWGGFAALFGADVDGPLEAYVAADEAGFAELLAGDGIGEPEGAGGYYEPSNGRAYLYRQPTAYYSRVLLLHELTHQYQDRVSGTSGLPFWYVEGLAESLGRHHWDGDCVELRVRPLLSWEDAAAAAQAELDAGLALEAVLSGESTSRPVAQELVRLLASDPSYSEGFAAWRDDGASSADFETRIASIDELEAALRDWVPIDQEPMTPVWLDWIPEGDAAARGFGDYSSAARVKGAVERFAMTTDAPSGGESVGTVYGYDEATGDIELALVSADGGVSRFAVVGGEVAWDVVGSVALDGAMGWSQAAGDGVTTVTIGGASVELPRTLPSAGGLALYAADADFSGIGWE